MISQMGRSIMLRPAPKSRVSASVKGPPERPGTPESARSSEQGLQSELRLPRRSRIACREARVGNHPERRAADRGDASRQPEVRLIEDVEHFDAELKPRGAGEREVPDDREIRVAESRTVDSIAPQVAEMEHPVCRHRQREHGTARARAGPRSDPRIADRVVEPLRGRSDDGRIPDEVGTQRIVHAVERADAGDDVNGAAGLRLRDDAQLPAFDERIVFEGQFVDRVNVLRRLRRWCWPSG